ncbi:aminopeptidase [bacterium CPR1]|nr:aminopeptidase [bacterium CPR1]
MLQHAFGKLQGVTQERAQVRIFAEDLGTGSHQPEVGFPDRQVVGGAAPATGPVAQGAHGQGRILFAQLLQDRQGALAVAEGSGILQLRVQPHGALHQGAGQLELSRMEKMQAFIGLRGAHNITEMSDVPSEHMGIYEKEWMKPVHLEQRVKHTRWVVLRWPNASMAQLAGMSSQAFEDFYFKVCLADYEAMEKAVKPLQELMAMTDRVRIVGPDTDLRFSIKGVGVVPCTGTHNVPDGECFTAPVRDSVEGHIHFNSGTIYRGTAFDDIRLTFEKGRVVKSSCSNDAALEAVLSSDEGARYFGEFAVAFNPFIEKPMRDILFDEKIRGSLHLALGECYEETQNHNRSNVHWDLVLRQEEGGELWFDDVLVRKDGRFVVDALTGLNPENLAGRKPALV